MIRHFWNHPFAYPLAASIVTGLGVAWSVAGIALGHDTLLTGIVAGGSAVGCLNAVAVAHSAAALLPQGDRE